MSHEPEDYLPTRRSLLSRLKDWDDQESWRDFFNTYWKLIYSTARKAGLDAQEAEEVVQETVLTVTKKIKDLKYDPALGTFKGWLLNTTRWRINDQFRKRSPARNDRHPAPDPRRTATIDRIPDSFDMDSVWEEQWQKNLVDAAIQRVKKKVSPKQYQIFDLYVAKGLPVSKVASTLGVSSAQVYLAKHRISALIKREVAELQTKLI